MTAQELAVLNTPVPQGVLFRASGDDVLASRRLGMSLVRRGCLVLAVAGACVLMGCGSSDRSDVTTTPATPKYSIVGTSNKRYDGEPTYFVLVDPIDVRNDAFKRDVKLVLEAVADADGSAKFSARIFDDEAIAREALSDETAPRPAQRPEESESARERRGQHLVAMYAGGVNTGLGYPYDIAWYPGAFTSTPDVGNYVDSEQWRPRE